MQAKNTKTTERDAMIESMNESLIRTVTFMQIYKQLLQNHS